MTGLLERKSSSSSSYAVLLYLFLVIMLETSIGAECALEYSQDKRTSNLSLEMIEKHLGLINKPAIMTFEGPNGDIIDCINIRKQLAFDHPLLKNHKLQLVPSEVPKGENDVPNRRNEVRGEGLVWHPNGRRCPKGTVPVRRTTVEDVLRAGSLSDFCKKQPKIALARYMVLPQTQGHEYAIMCTRPSNVTYGTTTAIDLWNPNVELDREFSLSQIWLSSGTYEDGDLNTVEVGWQIYPQLFGGRSPRLFVYWTRDAYKRTGCYNTRCPGFVQVSQSMYPGMILPRVSTISGPQNELPLTVFRDKKTGHWWLNSGNISVGYWPAKLFTRLAAGATAVMWGGEVVNSKPNGTHTATQMGSGRFAEEGYGKASYFQRLGLFDSNNTIFSPEILSPISTNSDCYSVIGVNNTSFYYGGPGRNAQCP